MLQPTSCGPGPPDKILQFNCKVLQEHNLRASQSKDNPCNAMNDNAKREYENDMIINVTKNPKTTKISTNNISNNYNNNNNCHMKSIKFYLKSTKQTTITTPPPPSAEFATSAALGPKLLPTLLQEGSTMLRQQWLLMQCGCKANATNVGMSFNNMRYNFSSCWAKWFLMFLMVFTILAQNPHQVAAEKSKHYYMQSLCKNHFLQQLYRKIDGAVLWSQNERNLDCIITFQTHSILQRFMLRFDMLQLDCNDHLYVYDGAHAVATPKIDISCRQTKQTVSSMLTRTNFVTLKYVTDNWGTDANGFKLVITSVKDPKHTCKDFTCVSNGFCIHPDLLCDGINHCSDNSDESVHNLCQIENP